MKLKNLMFVMAAASVLTACSNSDADSITGGSDSSKYSGSEYSNFTGTQASIGVEKLGLATMTTRSTALPDYTTAFTSGTATATYKVTVDPRMGYGDNAVAELSGEAYKIYTDVPTDTTSESTDHVYVMSTDGTGVTPFLVSVPAVDAVTSAVTTEYDAAKKAESVNQPTTWKDTTIENKTKVIWYLAEQVDNSWTVYGILTDRADLKSVKDICEADKKTAPTFKGKSYDELVTYYKKNTNISDLDKTLRYDIHQQEHATWGEIKTSLHIMQTGDVTVTLPIKSCYTLDATKDAQGKKTIEEAKYVKAFGQLFTCNGSNSEVKVTVTPGTDNVVIKVSGITEELLKTAARKYNDGITVEVHTFYKLTGDDACGEYKDKDLKETIWTALKTSTVSCPDDNKDGQITSAYYKEETDKKN